MKLWAEPWYLDRKNEVPEGKLPYYKIPVFNYHEVSGRRRGWRWKKKSMWRRRRRGRTCNMIGAGN